MIGSLTPLVCLVCLLTEPTSPGGKAADSTRPLPDASFTAEAREEVVGLLKGLDSDDFCVRQEAAAKLNRLATQPGLQEILAVELDRVLVAADTSLEVRKHVEHLRRALPPVALQPAGDVAIGEIDQLVRQLENDSYAMRLGATRRLEWLLSNPKAACRILVRVKQRLAEGELSADAPVWLERMYERARAAWLLSDPAGWELPPVSDEQISRWIEGLVRGVPPGGSPADRISSQTAKRELWDLLARDAYVPRVQAAITARLKAEALSPAAAGRLNELLDMTRPAMVAEYWEGRRHLGTQHLLVGVPSMREGAVRPSHFDSINDEVAHCVSGSNLAPGDYPVGVAIPHPNREGAAFHLVNLPTPRHRMAYACRARTDEALRLAELSQRTLDRLLRRRRPLDRAELIMVAQLDRAALSRFASKFFLAVEDQPQAQEEQLSANQYPPSSGRASLIMQKVGVGASRHGILAAMLAAEGTHEAAEGLLKALAAGRFLPPSPQAPYHLEWVAALAIAQRDPWPEAPTWLGSLIEQSLPLVRHLPTGPDLGATAAGILLAQHQQEPALLGLETTPDPLLAEVGLCAYRFSSPEARNKVAAWWKNQRTDGP